MKNKYYFPFGQELKPVSQKDRAPKKVFVLGVYASAVHARWIGVDGKQKVAALAVASEPEIFWKGKDTEQIIASINISKQLGKLVVPTDKKLNGPSGCALDELFLTPLNLDRNNTWLCDLLPESRVNPQQRKAIDKHYTKELINKYDLPPASVPDFDKTELNLTTRPNEILEELETSQADTLILLGDLPIYWFLRFFDNNYKKLSDFGNTTDSYGFEKKVLINNKEYKVIALCHPRQAAKLGSYSKKWYDLHLNWLKNKQSIMH